MNTSSRFLAWLEAHQAYALDLVRIYLGTALFVRGVLFIMEPERYFALANAVGEPAFGAMALGHYVALAHLAGGAFLAVGLITRVAAFVQLPVLAGAAYAVAGTALATPNQSLELTFLVLFLLVVFALAGAGPLSLDHVLFGRPEPEERPRQLGLFDVNGRTEREDRAPEPSATRAEREETVGPACVHGRDRHHPRVEVERQYRLGGRLRFLTGTTGRPARLVFRCRDCGGVAEVSEAPADLDRYMYRERA